jgi:hypothetical protein
MCCLVPALKSRLLLAIVMIKQVTIGSYKNQTSLLFPFSLLCGPWKNTVYLKCCHPHSLAQSSYIMSLHLSANHTPPPPPSPQEIPSSIILYKPYTLKVYGLDKLSYLFPLVSLDYGTCFVAGEGGRL